MNTKALSEVLKLEDEAMEAHVELCRLKAQFDKDHKIASQKLNMALTKMSVAVAMLKEMP